MLGGRRASTQPPDTQKQQTGDCTLAACSVCVLHPEGLSGPPQPIRVPSPLCDVMRLRGSFFRVLANYAKYASKLRHRVFASASPAQLQRTLCCSVGVLPSVFWWYVFLAVPRGHARGCVPPAGALCCAVTPGLLYCVFALETRSNPLTAGSLPPCSMRWQASKHCQKGGPAALPVLRARAHRCRCFKAARARAGVRPVSQVLRAFGRPAPAVAGSRCSEGGCKPCLSTPPPSEPLLLPTMRRSGVYGRTGPSTDATRLRRAVHAALAGAAAVPAGHSPAVHRAGVRALSAHLAIYLFTALSLSHLHFHSSLFACISEPRVSAGCAATTACGAGCTCPCPSGSSARPRCTARHAAQVPAGARPRHSDCRLHHTGAG